MSFKELRRHSSYLNIFAKSATTMLSITFSSPTEHRTPFLTLLHIELSRILSTIRQNFCLVCLGVPLKSLFCTSQTKVSLHYSTSIPSLAQLFFFFFCLFLCYFCSTVICWTAYSCNFSIIILHLFLKLPTSLKSFFWALSERSKKFCVASSVFSFSCISTFWTNMSTSDRLPSHHQSEPLDLF